MYHFFVNCSVEGEGVANEQNSFTKPDGIG